MSQQNPTWEQNPLRTIRFHFHKWTKWEQYEARGISYGWSMKPNQIGVPYSELRQKRHCIVCNYTQDRQVDSH